MIQPNPLEFPHFNQNTVKYFNYTIFKWSPSSVWEVTRLYYYISRKAEVSKNQDDILT